MLSYVLLLRAFRSIVLPAKAVVMNLLSIAATYGVPALMKLLGTWNWYLPESMSRALRLKAVRAME